MRNRKEIKTGSESGTGEREDGAIVEPSIFRYVMFRIDQSKPQSVEALIPVDVASVVIAKLLGNVDLKPVLQPFSVNGYRKLTIECQNISTLQNLLHDLLWEADRGWQAFDALHE